MAAMESLFQGSRRARQPGRLKATVWAGPPDTGRPETTQGGSGGAPESGPASAAGYRPRPSTGNTWSCSLTSMNTQQRQYHKYRHQDASSYSLTNLSCPRTGQLQLLTMPIQTYSVPIVMIFVSWIIKNLRQHAKISFMGNKVVTFVLQTNNNLLIS